MCKFCLALWLALILPCPVYAVDLTIADPTVAGLEISVNASLSATTNYYLQGTLRSQSSSKYFGETQNNRGDWIDYVSSPEKEYVTSNFFVTDVKNASWSGMVKLRFKLDDPTYVGPGPYDLKLRRFTGGSSSSAGDSNTLSVNLTVTLPTPTPSPSPSPTLAPTPTPTPQPTPSPSPVGAGSTLPSPPVQLSSPPPVGTVAGESTEIDLSGFGVSPSPAEADYPPPAKVSLNKSRAKTVLLIGSGLLFISLAGFFGYRKYSGTISQ